MKLDDDEKALIVRALEAFAESCGDGRDWEIGNEDDADKARRLAVRITWMDS